MNYLQYIGSSLALYLLASFIHGISGLECFQCNDVPHPHNCNITKICDDIHEVCITAEDVNDRFLLSYKLGCTTKEFCDGGLSLFGRRKRTLRHVCCSNDLCNKYDIMSTTSQPAQTTRQPTQTTRQPIQTTRQPTQTTRQPTQTTRQPTQTTRQPTQTTRQPMLTTRQLTQTTRQIPTTKEMVSPTTATQKTTEITTENTTHSTTHTTHSTTHTTPVPCRGQDFFQWKGTCFFLKTKLESWTSSDHDPCKTVSMNMAVIRHQDEQHAVVDFIQNIRKYHHEVWLGAHYNFQRHHWQWIDGHSIGKYDRRWKVGQSDEHDCMILFKGVWYGRRCELRYAHLCEKSIH